MASNKCGCNFFLNFILLIFLFKDTFWHCSSIICIACEKSFITRFYFIYCCISRLDYSGLMRPLGKLENDFKPCSLKTFISILLICR